MTDDKIEVVIEDSEENPTDARRRIKVLEMPIFSYDDKRKLDATVSRMNSLIDTIEKSHDSQFLEEINNKINRIARSSPPDAEINALMEMRDSITTLATSFQKNDERMVSFLGRAVENIENMSRSLVAVGTSLGLFNERFNEIENKIEEKVYELDSNVNYLKGSVIDATDKIKNASDGMDKKTSLIIEGVNEKFDAHISNINNRMDNMTLQVVEPLNDISLRIENLKTSQEALETINAQVEQKINDMKSVSDNFSAMLSKIEESSTAVEDSAKKSSRRMEAASRSVARNMKSAEKKYTAIDKSLRKTLDEIKRKDTEIKGMLRDVQKINLRLSKMDDADFLLRVIEARNRMGKYRTARFTKEDKKRVSVSLVAIENDLVDLSIIALLRKKKMNLTMISKSVLATDKKIRERVKVLTNANRIKKERLGRYFVYSAV